MYIQTLLQPIKIYNLYVFQFLSKSASDFLLSKSVNSLQKIAHTTFQCNQKVKTFNITKIWLCVLDENIIDIYYATRYLGDHFYYKYQENYFLSTALSSTKSVFNSAFLVITFCKLVYSLDQRLCKSIRFGFLFMQSKQITSLPPLCSVRLYTGVNNVLSKSKHILCFMLSNMYIQKRQTALLFRHFG